MKQGGINSSNGLCRSFPEAAWKLLYETKDLRLHAWTKNQAGLHFEWQAQIIELWHSCGWAEEQIILTQIRAENNTFWQRLAQFM